MYSTAATSVVDPERFEERATPQDCSRKSYLFFGFPGPPLPPVIWIRSGSRAQPLV